jgi:hypothetical protein
MSGVRFWIILAAAVSFLAGMAAGVLLTRSNEAEPTSGWTAYADRLAADFDLAPDRQSALRILLDEYATEVAHKRRAFEARMLNQIEPELRELAARYDSYIRDAVLPSSQRAAYDRLSRPLELVAAQ